ncbi:pro-resilin-like [Penaeus indicus]|uniref:pro-resilin-like n=1 Tax=Penaeus indicus TaxID=29960 RepID=UPI00300C36B2
MSKRAVRALGRRVMECRVTAICLSGSWVTATTTDQDLICELVFLALALSTSVLCDDLGGLLHGKGINHAPAHYAFNYGVQDAYFGTNFGHAESRDGYNTEGVYYVHLPDGRLQTVKYYADEHGFHPEVAYSGVAHHAAGYH